MSPDERQRAFFDQTANPEFIACLRATIGESAVRQTIKSVCQREGSIDRQLFPDAEACVSILLVGYFLDICDPRELVWRCGDSLSIRKFLCLEAHDQLLEYQRLRQFCLSLSRETAQQIFDTLFELTRSDRKVADYSLQLPLQQDWIEYIRCLSGDGRKIIGGKDLNKSGVLDNTRKFIRDRVVSPCGVWLNADSLKVKPVESNSTQLSIISLLIAAISSLAMIAIFPVSGEGDAIAHFDNLRQGLVDPKNILHPWARPGYALINLPAAYFGLLPSRLFHLAVALAAYWQTFRFACDLRLANAHLVILFCALQPFALILSGDTMTELPFSLVTVILLRLWHHRKYAAFTALVGFSPLVRPEGLFLGVLMGLLFLFKWPSGLPMIRRWMAASFGLAGLFTWSLAGYIWASDWLYFYHTWPWGTMLQYGSGNIYDYTIHLPEILGAAFCIPWIVGCIFSRRHDMLLCQGVWWMVFLVHSILWDKGWMGAYGLLRIIACVTPCAGVTMLVGWNRIQQLFDLAPRSRSFVLLGFFLIAVNVAFVQNLLSYRNHFGRMTPVLLPAFQKSVADAPWFFTDDPTVIALAGLRNNDPRRLDIDSEGNKQTEFFKTLPKGTIGMWSNHHGAFTNGMSCDRLLSLGYEAIADERLVISPTFDRDVELHGVVVRKVR